MKPFRILIADDEPLARSGLARMIASHRDFELIGECSDGVEAVAAIRRSRPDLALLDIEMPGRDGFAVLGDLSADERPLAIFVTAYDAHALRAFDVNAVDYVLKPVVQERLHAALDRAAVRLRQAGRKSAALSSQDLERLAALVRTRPPYLERFLVRSPGGGIVVPVSEVLYMEADGDYVRLHRGKGHELMRSTLQSVLERLDPEIFVRIHRSYAVRLDRITKIEGSGGDGSVILDDGTELPLSRTYREALLAALDRC
jgi:two-component system LytT family response regulator